MLQLQPEIERYREDGLSVVLVTGDSEEVVAAILEEYHLDVTVLDDRDRSIRGIFGVSRYPSGYLFDRQGRLIETYTGWNSEESLAHWKAKVEQALAD